MDAIQLLAELQRIPPNKYSKIVELVLDNKYVFNRHGLRPNAIDCIDGAVVKAKSLGPMGEYPRRQKSREYLRGTDYRSQAESPHKTGVARVLELLKSRSREDPYMLIFNSYTLFVALVRAVERANYRSSESIAGKHSKFDGIPTTQLQESLAYGNVAELQAIRTVFDIYVTAKLMQHGMSKYPERLGLCSLI